MENLSRGPTRLTFGQFVADLATERLWNRGTRIRLTGQPWQILTVLLARPGEIVSREQLRQQIWGDGTFVDYEHSLNAAMNRLRRALNDTAEFPRYITTVPGQGYRFIGVVSEVAAAEPVAAQAVLPPEPLVTTREMGGTSRSILWRLRWGLAIVAGICMTVGAVLWIRRGPAFGGDGRIVLAQFINRTGDAVFDYILQQVLATQLQDSPFLSLVPEERIHATLGLMGRPADAPLTEALSREVCERTGGGAVLDGSIAKLGTQYLIWLTARDCMTGGIVYRDHLQAPRKGEVLATLGELAKRLRSRAGEALSTVEKHSMPLTDVTTPSLEAWRAFSIGMRVAFSSGYAAAIPHFKRAVELDPDFATAWAHLSRMYADINEPLLSAEAARKAYQLRGHASERERFMIVFNYDRQITGNLQKTQQTLEQWAQIYPRDPLAHALMSGLTTQGTGLFDKTIEEGNRALALDPDLAPAFVNVASAQMYLGRFADAEVTVQRAAARHLDIDDLLELRYYLAFVRGDLLEMEQQVARAKGRRGAEDWMCHQQALVLSHAGRLREARVMSRRAVELAEQMGDSGRAALYEAGRAIYEAAWGNASAATKRAQAALAFSNDRDATYAAGFALAMAGDVRNSQALEEDLARRFPQDTTVRFTYVPTLRAMATLAGGDCARALELLEAAAPYDLATPPVAMLGAYGPLYPAYVRGDSYLAAHRGIEAAAEFEKFVDHRGLVLADPMGTLAHLQLARAWALTRDKERARRMYDEFFRITSAGDPDLDVIHSARREYRQLE